MSGILTEILTGILSGIITGIIKDCTIYVKQAVIVNRNLVGILTRVLVEILVGILTGILTGVLTGILSGVLTEILTGILAGIIKDCTLVFVHYNIIIPPFEVGIKLVSKELQHLTAILQHYAGFFLKHFFVFTNFQEEKENTLTHLRLDYLKKIPVR